MRRNIDNRLRVRIKVPLAQILSATFLMYAATSQSQPASAVLVTCPAKYQPFEGRCVSQAMSDYIACVQVSGANKESIKNDILKADTERTSGDLGGKGGAKGISGAAGITLTKESEKIIADKSTTKWFEAGMATCAELAKALAR